MVPSWTLWFASSNTHRHRGWQPRQQTIPPHSRRGTPSRRATTPQGWACQVCWGWQTAGSKRQRREHPWKKFEQDQWILLVAIVRRDVTKKGEKKRLTGLLWVLPHQSGPQAFVEPLDALRLEKLLGDLSRRHGSWCRDGCAGDVGAAGHGVGGHQLCRRHHDWFLLLGRWREKSKIRPM